MATSDKELLDDLYSNTPDEGQRSRSAVAWMRDTLLAGLFLLLPFGMLFFLLFQVWKLMRKKMYQLTDVLGVGGDLRMATALVLGASVLFVLFMIAGLVVRAGAQGKLRRWLERNLLRLIPGYGLMRMRLAEKLGQKTPRVPALLRTANGLQPVLVMDSDAARALVFMPNAPGGDSGALVVVDPARLEGLDVGVLELDDLLHALGRGLLPKIPPSVQP
jgi:uncharacterized membrane protein